MQIHSYCAIHIETDKQYLILMMLIFTQLYRKNLPINGVVDSKSQSSTSVPAVLVAVELTVYKMFHVLMMDGRYADTYTFLQHLIQLEKVYQETKRSTR